MTENSDQSMIEFITQASLEISDGDVCFVGIGVPSLAAMVAKRHHAPNAVLVYESGAVDSDPPIPPLSTGSPSVVQNTAMIMSCMDVFSMLQQGVFDVGLLSAAQVDRFGNLNSTELSRLDKAPIRLVGSGGANDISMLAKHTLILMSHDERRFTRQVDFITSPGVTDQGEPSDFNKRGGGPKVLITPRARFTFETGELTLDAVNRRFSIDDAIDIYPWKVPHSSPVKQLPKPEVEYTKTAKSLLSAWGRTTQ